MYNKTEQCEMYQICNTKTHFLAIANMCDVQYLNDRVCIKSLSRV